MPPRKRYRCRFCGVVLPAWLPVAKRPESSMLLYHLGQRRMETECIDAVLSELFDVVEEEAI
jgi:hypothetical protein